MRNRERLVQRRTGGIVTWLVLALAVTSVAGWFIWRNYSGKKATKPISVIRHIVAKMPFENTVVERGEVESSNNIEVRCQVKARNGPGTAIVEVVEEGALVRQGDILVKLDSTALEQERVQQQIACNTKKAALIDAQNTFESAEIAKQEYLEGTYHQEEQTIKGEILIAEENLRRAREYLTYSERLAARGYVTSQQLEGDSFSVEKAKTELETAKTKLRVLQEYTKAKKLKELESDIKSAEALWQSEQSSYDLELAKLKDIEQQIALCTIRAPQDGQVIYANTQSFRGGGTDFVVEPGAVARENQALIRLPDSTQMQVKAKINEARVTLVQSGMPAKVRLDALGDSLFDGVVTRVNEYPEPSSWFSSQVKEYATYIKIKGSPQRIRPGLTAEVTIMVETIPDAVTVPVQAVVEQNRRYFCLVQHGTDWQPRLVDVTATNEKYAVVTDGIDVGDVVALNPKALAGHVSYPKLDSPTAETPVSLTADAPPQESPGRQGRPRGPGGQ